MEVLASRVLLHPRDLAVSRRFYEETLGLAVYREFGTPEHPGVVFFLGTGFLELSGSDPGGPSAATRLLLQVRDVATEHERLKGADVRVVDGPEWKPWGLLELTVCDPDGLHLVLVEIPEDHPQRRHVVGPSVARRTTGA